MKELLYMWIDSVSNRANIFRQGILFSNDYSVKLNREADFDDIVSLHICKKENIYQNFYGDKIASISALVGVNGVGKTTILDILGSSRDIRKRYLYDWRFFLIYKMDDKYIVEGNGKDIVENFIKNIPDNAKDEFSFICQYDEVNGIFLFENLCSASGEIENYIKYFYYQDKPGDAQGYLINEYELDTDNNICFERIDMKPTAASIYKTSYLIKDDVEFNSHINLHNLKFWIEANNDYRIKIRNDNGRKTIKKVFIIRVLLAIICQRGDKEVLSSLPVDIHKGVFEYNAEEYEQYRTIMTNAINSYKEWGWKKNKIIATDLIHLIEQIPDRFFPQYSDDKFGLYRVNFSFSINDFFVNEIYELLLKYSEYLSFSYTGISAGEKKILDVFTGLFVHINKLSNFTVQGERTNIILLDEPDKGLHPEMSRRFICWLTKVFNDIKVDGYKYQFILTTHSPFLISDIPIPSVHCLKHDKKRTGIWITEVSDSKYGLLNSIPDIMKDTFFMDSPFGEYGNQYFIYLVNEISNMKSLDDTDKINILKKKIRAINDPVLRKYLEKSYEKQIETIGTIIDQIKYHEEKIKELNELKGESV